MAKDNFVYITEEQIQTYLRLENRWKTLKEKEIEAHWAKLDALQEFHTFCNKYIGMVQLKIIREYKENKDWRK